MRGVSPVKLERTEASCAQQVKLDGCVHWETELCPILHPHLIPMDYCLDPAPSTDDDRFQADSLPEVVESVSKAQKQQASEIEQHQQLFITLQEELLKARGQVISLTGEFRECLRKTCLAEEEAAKKRTHCKQLQDAINSMVLDNASLKQMMERSDEDRMRESRMYQVYTDKMETYRKSMLALEAHSEDHMEHARESRIVEDMEKKRASLKEEVEVDQESGELLAKLRLEEECHQLLITQTELQQKLHQLQQEVSQEKSKQAGVKQDIEVLQKRNKAQLTRLKCQLKEAQLRNWQWSHESEQLETQLEQLKEKDGSTSQD